MTDLFVSYKSEDRARVAPLVAALEADSVGVWWDAHIGSGSSWRQSIETNLNEARCVLVVWSERSVGSEGSFVRDEATRSLRRGTYLPVRIDPVDPPLGFGETQAASLIGWKGDRTDARYQEVLAAVRAVVAGGPRPIPPVYQPPSWRGIDRRLVIGGTAAVVAAGAAGWWATHRPDAPGDSVAVLPFANLSGDPAQAFFSDGIAEELRDALTRIASLKVAGRSSSEKMRDADAPTAAAKLGVANILSGTVRRGSGMIRINAELVDGISGLTRWSQAYDRAIGDTLAIQSDIADSVAGALKIALGGAQKALLVQGGTSNPVAQETYLRGLALARKNKIKESLPQFEAAIAADPNYGKAYLSLGGNGAALANNTLSGAALRMRLGAAEQAARHALALMPGSGRPYAVLGLVFQGRLDLRRAKDAYDTAYRALPGDATVLRSKAYFDSLMGDSDAIGLYQRAVTLDPLRTANARQQANILYFLGRLDQSIAVAQTALIAIPGDPNMQAQIASAQLVKGQPAEAAKTAALVPANDENRPVADAIVIMATTGAAADRALAAFTAKYGTAHQYELAEIHAWRREPDLAFAAIARAWDGLEPNLAGLKTDPLLAPIRSDPRYGEWLRKIGFP